eukprot:TRINITY_DN6991_c3_g1_i1.p1 TRINITY_DN6991_c3_g1~~TRINITY_DN6991_c3_g1_i1.p1  ORF type:complete len:242 (+),score=63.73 TRINITY_DN6991_c3_g1_i1:46-726(+)
MYRVSVNDPNDDVIMMAVTNNNTNITSSSSALSSPSLVSPIFNLTMASLHDGRSIKKFDSAIEIIFHAHAIMINIGHFFDSDNNNDTNNNNNNNSSSNNLCLGYLDEEVSPIMWKCEAGVTLDANGNLRGLTDHFTAFGILVHSSNNRDNAPSSQKDDLSPYVKKSDQDTSFMSLDLTPSEKIAVGIVVAVGGVGMIVGGVLLWRYMRRRTKQSPRARPDELGVCE